MAVSTYNLLLLLVLLLPSDCYISLWQPPPPIPVNVQIAGLPLQMVEQEQPFQEMRYMDQALPISINHMRLPSVPSAKEGPYPENPWLSMIKTVASVMNNSIDWEREKTRLQEIKPANEQSPADYPFILQSVKPEVNSADERSFYKGSNTGLARLLNSISPPPALQHIGRFLSTQQQDKLGQELPAAEEKKSFPISKDNTVNNFYDDGTVIGLITSGQLEKVDWSRKILGIDELPTKEEGNAIAQLLEEHH